MKQGKGSKEVAKFPGDQLSKDKDRDPVMLIHHRDNQGMMVMFPGVINRDQREMYQRHQWISQPVEDAAVRNLTRLRRFVRRLKD